MAHAVVDPNSIEARHGVFRPLREPLGVTAFGINQIELAPNVEGPSTTTAGTARRRST
jgi:hypothetical protein